MGSSRFMLVLFLLLTAAAGADALAPDGRALTIIAVAPVSRRVLTSIVTDDRR